MVSRMTEAVCTKLNNQTAVYLPKINQRMNDLMDFREKMELKENKKEQSIMDGTNQPILSHGIDESRITQIEFHLNTMKSEVGYQKNLFGPKQLVTIDNLERKLENMAYQTEINTLKLETFVTNDQFETI